VHVEEALCVIAARCHDFVYIFDQLSCVYPRELLHKFLVCDVAIAIGVDVLVQGDDFFFIHLHLKHSDLVLEFFESDALARVGVHHLENGAKTQITSVHIIFNLGESALQNLIIIGVAGVSESARDRLMSSIGGFIMAAEPMRSFKRVSASGVNWVLLVVS